MAQGQHSGIGQDGAPDRSDEQAAFGADDSRHRNRRDDRHHHFLGHQRAEQSRCRTL